MPHHKSAEKRVRTNERDRQHNVANRSRLKKVMVAQRSLTDPAEAKKGLPAASSEIDKAVKKGLIPRRRADRMKSRTQKAVNRLG